MNGAITRMATIDVGDVVRIGPFQPRSPAPAPQWPPPPRPLRLPRDLGATGSATDGPSRRAGPLSSSRFSGTRRRDGRRLARGVARPARMRARTV